MELAAFPYFKCLQCIAVNVIEDNSVVSVLQLAVFADELIVGSFKLGT